MKGGDAVLEDNFILLAGLIEAKIRWSGSLDRELLQWTTSEDGLEDGPIGIGSGLKLNKRCGRPCVRSGFSEHSN